MICFDPIPVLDLVGSLIYQRKDYEKAIKPVYLNKLFFKKLITDNFPFLLYLDVYHHIEKMKEYRMNEGNISIFRYRGDRVGYN